MLLFRNSYYKDSKGRISVLMDIERSWDEPMYVHLFVMPDTKLQTVTYNEMVTMIDKGMLVEFYPERYSTEAVWGQRALDQERFKTELTLRNGKRW